VFPLATKIMAS